MPVKFSPALATEICRRLRSGESLRTICAGAGMPARFSVLRWRREFPDFNAMADAAVTAAAEDGAMARLLALSAKAPLPSSDVPREALDHWAAVYEAPEPIPAWGEEHE